MQNKTCHTPLGRSSQLHCSTTKRIRKIRVRRCVFRTAIFGTAILRLWSNRPLKSVIGPGGVVPYVLSGALQGGIFLSLCVPLGVNVDSTRFRWENMCPELHRCTLQHRLILYHFEHHIVPNHTIPCHTTTTSETTLYRTVGCRTIPYRTVGYHTITVL